jgi:prepilin-type N-terminal cleavage/methylation domain-containing protein
MANKENGFSLVELVVAMTVTLIISGAVLQLVTAGQTAFRREPELADRQQNIRVGMDVISQDVYRVGYGVPQFAQVFTDALDGVGPMGSGGAATDEIEMFMAAECPPAKVCPVSGQAGNRSPPQLLSECYRCLLVLLADQSTWALRWGSRGGTTASATDRLRASRWLRCLPRARRRSSTRRAAWRLAA